MKFYPIPAGTVCESCTIRPATELFANSMTDVVHGSHEYICALCVIRRQIIHIEDMVKTLPKLYRERDKIMAKEIGLDFR